MRRKTLSNCLKSNFSFSTDTIYQIFDELGFDRQIRGEALSTKDFVDLSNKIYEYKKRQN